MSSFDRRCRRTFALLVACGLPCGWAADEVAANQVLIDRGRYLTVLGGCNDCHTPGFADSGGTVPVNTWLTGDKLGWRGPWGTTYASNLRLYIGGLTEAQWVDAARTIAPRPPMPWWALRAMTDGDLRAVYRFVRSLGPAGEPAPPYVAAGQEPPQPYVQFPSPPPQ